MLSMQKGGMSLDRGLAVIGVVTVALIVLGYVLRHWIYRGYQKVQDVVFVSSLNIKSQEEMPAGMPVAPFYDYDTTEYKAMFTILGVDPAKQTMKLRFVYPFKLRDNEITSHVTCSLENTYVYWTQIDELKPAERGIYEEEQIVPGETTMQAKCDEQYCREISKYCELWH